eukprot:TRINITY_DN193_c0_g1_i2.p1 TRINITY_DN193_c0_g1~~TRINITY_DN193_c0_g1_i2.p1  ORF type:complete len:550 (-),score=91.78 TRINITY_DN193_c0_g1_i2:77-1726(-)
MSYVFGVSMKFVCAFALHLPLISAQQPRKFLGHRPRGTFEKRGPADLLAELESEEHAAEFDHANMTAARTQRLEKALMPLYKITPKDADGQVDADAARYMLHRLFANRHGWFVNGLEFHDSLLGTSNVGQALYGGGKSFSIHQLARFAASIETLVHAENIKRLQEVFDLLEFSRQRPYTSRDAKNVVESYMILFVTIMMPDDTFEDRRIFCETKLPEWNDTVVFSNDVLRNVHDDLEKGQQISLWEFTLRVVEDIGERYGRWQNKGCIRLKSKLMEMETPGTGRVPLDTFWQGYVDQVPLWPFRESIEHLQQLGALDDSAAPHYSVAIPNYLLSASNCLAGSRYYDVCCLNECEEILGEIELRVDAATAPPGHLAELVANLPSSTVSAPRVLPAPLLERLHGIANHHGGVVPLHGRLFWQFLSHAYPRECPYPALSISKPVEDKDTWIKRTEDHAEVDFEEAAEYIMSVKNRRDHHDIAVELPWTDEEELFLQYLSVEATQNDNADGRRNALVLILGFVLVACALAFRLWQPIAELAGLQGKNSGGYYV